MGWVGLGFFVRLKLFNMYIYIYIYVYIYIYIYYNIYIYIHIYIYINTLWQLFGHNEEFELCSLGLKLSGIELPV